MNKLFKKDFTIRSRRSGSRLAGRENQVVYAIYTADGSRMVKDGFYRKADADAWLSRSIRRVNEILKAVEIGALCPSGTNN